jgi:hypothetical protein
VTVGASAKRPRHRTRTTDSQHTHPVAEHVLGRDFTATAPNTRVGSRYHRGVDGTGVALSRGGPGPVPSHGRRMGHGCASGSRSGGKREAVDAGASASSAWLDFLILIGEANTPVTTIRRSWPVTAFW